ncbi:MAG TPA: hypothetical protein IAB39_03965 [Candidatus Onthovicinus excrementipullorum]|nr:hypothetical protein [Candidatus Onthovicinus excrementipullorum]
MAYIVAFMVILLPLIIAIKEMKRPAQRFALSESELLEPTIHPASHYAHISILRHPGRCGVFFIYHGPFSPICPDNIALRMVK